MKKNETKLELLDTTLRDGGYHIDFQFTAEDTARVCRGLEDAGYGIIEIGHGLGLGASSPKLGVAAATDEEYAEAAAKSLKKARFGAFFIPGVGTKEQLKTARGIGMHFIRIGTNVTDIEKGRPFVEYAKELGFEVWYNFMKTYAVPPAEFARLAAQTAKWGADAVAVVDSAGCMTPDEVRAYVSAAKAACGGAAVGIHAHNNLHLAMANSLSAIEAGADRVDVTLRGMGRSSGNAQSDVLLALLKKLGRPLPADYYKTTDLSEECIAPRLQKRGQGSDPEELTCGAEGFHSGYMPLVEEASRAYGVDFRDLIGAVCRANLINPSRELFFEKAKELSRSKERQEA